MASEGLGELVEVTGEDVLKPFVVQITGPLIRIIGDRFPSSVSDVDSLERSQFDDVFQLPETDTIEGTKSVQKSCECQH
jgi:hypothetical protein